MLSSCIVYLLIQFILLIRLFESEIIAYIVELWEVIGIAVLITPSVCVTPKVHHVYNNAFFCYGSCSNGQHTSHRVCTEIFEMASIIIYQELCILEMKKCTCT